MLFNSSIPCPPSFHRSPPPPALAHAGINQRKHAQKPEQARPVTNDHAQSRACLRCCCFGAGLAVDAAQLTLRQARHLDAAAPFFPFGGAGIVHTKRACEIVQAGSDRSSHCVWHGKIMHDNSFCLSFFILSRHLDGFCEPDDLGR
eukprot:3246327-Pleurochrysis_carterae.AAC.2